MRYDSGMDGAAIVERLLQVPGATLTETHASWVVLTGDRVLKIKKPVQWSFLDYRSLEKRLAACREEVRINQALAPQIYLGVRPILVRNGGVVLGERGESDGAVEFCVEMKRFDEDATVAARLAAGSLGKRDMAAVGSALAAFHDRAERCHLPSAVDALRDRIEADLSDLENAGVPGGVAEHRAFGDGLVRRCAEELASRAAAGSIRDGHGDLRADHVVLGQPILIVDRIEFDPDLRRVDVADDFAFLLMDLESRGGKWAADELVAAYSKAGGNLAGRALGAGFAWRRALVRAKVALLRGDDERAAELLDLTARFAWRSRISGVVVVCGPPASGKSTLANTLGRAADVEVVSSDLTRKDLLGIGQHDRAPASAYSPEVDSRVYASLLRRAADTGGSQPLILDATYRHEPQRGRLEATVGAPVTWVWCDPPVGVRAVRAKERMRDTERISDADEATSDRLAGEFEPLSGSHVVHLTSAGEPSELLAQLANELDRG